MKLPILPRCTIYRSCQRKFGTVPIRKDHFSYCSELVKKRDYENYLCLLLQPIETQTLGIIVRAFNIELAQIQDSTTEIHTAKMRIEFWHRSIEETFEGHPPSHPVAIALALSLEKKMLSKHWFIRLIDIREKYLTQRPFMSLTDAEEYGDYSVTPMYSLLLENMNITDDNAIHAASHIGKVSSLVTLIRGAPYFVQNRTVLLPTELCMKHSISQEDVIRQEKTENIKEVIFDIASQANIHLEHTKKLMCLLPRYSRNVFLPVIPYGMFLSHLQKLNFDMYNSNLNQKQFLLPLKLLIASLKKKI